MRKHFFSINAFTLLEIILTVSIFSVCAVSVIHGYFSNVKAMKSSKNYGAAIEVAENLLVQLFARGNDSGKLRTDLQVPSGFSLDVKTIPQSLPFADMIQPVEMNLQWGPATRTSRINISTILIDKKNDALK